MSADAEGARPGPDKRDRPWYVQILEAIAASGLRAVDRSVLCAGLQYVSRKDGLLWPSMETLAADLGRSPSTVRAAVRRLERAGIWEVVSESKGGVDARGNGISNRWRWHFDKLNPPKGGGLNPPAVGELNPPVADVNPPAADVEPAGKQRTTRREPSLNPPGAGGELSIEPSNEISSEPQPQEPASPTDLAPADAHTPTGGGGGPHPLSIQFGLSREQAETAARRMDLDADDWKYLAEEAIGKRDPARFILHMISKPKHQWDRYDAFRGELLERREQAVRRACTVPEEASDAERENWRRNGAMINNVWPDIGAIAAARVIPDEVLLNSGADARALFRRIAEAALDRHPERDRLLAEARARRKGNPVQAPTAAMPGNVQVHGESNGTPTTWQRNAAPDSRLPSNEAIFAAIPERFRTAE